MLDVQIENKYRICIAGSKGTQVKFYKDRYFYKQNTLGNEGTSESLCSLLLDCTDVHHVKYYPCLINGKHGCYSKDFLRENENLVTLNHLHLVHTSKDFNDYILTMDSVKERYIYLISFVREVTGLDIQNYVDNLLCLDFITLNPDRHASNIAFIQGEDYWRIAPIFDNGQALGANYSITPPGEFNESCLAAATLSGSFVEQLLVTESKLKINYVALFELLNRMPESRNKNILIERLNVYSKYFKVI